MLEMSPLGAFFSGQGHLCFFCLEGHAIFVTPTHEYRKYNISMYFLIKIIFFFHFLPKEKITYFIEEKKYHLSRYYKKDHVQARIFWRNHLFRTFERNIIFPGIFWIIFLLCLKKKIIFLGKRNIIFPDNTRKIIFYCDCFGKTIFSKYLKKECFD